MTITFGVSEEHLTLASNNESNLAEYCDERVCLSASISQELYAQSLLNFLRVTYVTYSMRMKPTADCA